MKLSCKHCNSSNLIKSGLTEQSKQRYLCKSCGKRFIKDYTYNAYYPNIKSQIILLTKEGLGIRSTSRVLQISPTTLLKRILQIAKKLRPPTIKKGREYQVDELRTFYLNKKKPLWVMYALDSQSKEVVNLKVGSRSEKNLKVIIDTLSLSCAKKIITDKLNIYKSLIENKIHSIKYKGINHI